MFEKEADFAETKMLINCNGDYSKKKDYKKGWQDGAEFGYNKAKEDAEKMKSRFLELCNLKDMRIAELEKANEWHFPSKGELPETSGKYLVYTGGDPFVLEFDTDYNAFGYWVATLGDNWGVREIDFETVKDRGEDDVIAWKEIVLPELKESE